MDGWRLTRIRSDVASLDGSTSELLGLDLPNSPHVEVFYPCTNPVPTLYNTYVVWNHYFLEFLSSFVLGGDVKL